MGNRAFGVFAALFVFACAAWTAAPARATESYDACTGFIDALPATITAQGTWCLRKHLSTSISAGAAITIAVNNATLDCNDFKIGGLGAGPATEASGVKAQDRVNVTVRHCNIRGFNYGVFLDGAAGGGHLVEDNHVSNNRTRGIWLWGDGSVIRRNLVDDTGGDSRGFAAGIQAHFDVDVLDNTVSGVLPGPDVNGNGDAYGIYVLDNSSGSISGNRVRGLMSVGDYWAYGIYAHAFGRVTMFQNHVIGDGSLTSLGLRCSGEGRAMGNVVNGFGTPISSCRDDGNSL